MTNRTQRSCRNTIAAWEANACPPDRSAIIGKLQDASAAMTQWVLLPSAWPRAWITPGNRYQESLPHPRPVAAAFFMDIRGRFT